MKHSKIQIDDNIFYEVANKMRRELGGFRGLSSKKKRIHEKNVKKIIPMIVRWYISDKMKEVLSEA